MLGPSGCGKTTLLKSLIGLTNLTKGEIYIDNELRNPQNKNLIDLTKLGFMPQVRIGLINTILLLGLITLFILLGVLPVQ